MHIVIVAGEVSGDILGAGLMVALQELNPTIYFSGVGGERMCALGFKSLFPLDRLSVMGLIEPLKRLPELLHIRKSIKQHCLDQNVDAFIGIDSPDFNLNIERFVKKRGIKSIHYVSPSVWAWRQGRIRGIKKSVDLMLTLLPFEADFYHQHQIPVCFVGHPLADDIALNTDQQQARNVLGFSDQRNNTQYTIALMPGSRSSEIALLGELFLQVAQQIDQTLKQCQFLIPCANAARREQIEQILARNDFTIDYQLFDGQSHEVMAASNAVLLASGTTALEAMLLKKPMVVAYKMSNFSFWIISKMVRSKFVALPNLLADKAIVPELLQQQANLTELTDALLPLLTGNENVKAQTQLFTDLHQSIRKDASKTAAHAIMELLV